MRFYILKHGKVYNLLRVENYGVYIALYQIYGHTKTEHAFVYKINHTKLGGDIGAIYCGTLFDKRNYSPIRSLEKGTGEQFMFLGK